MRTLAVLLLVFVPMVAHAEDLGNLSANPFDPNSTSNPFGAGSPFAQALGFRNLAPTAPVFQVRGSRRTSRFPLSAA